MVSSPSDLSVVTLRAISVKVDSSCSPQLLGSAAVSTGICLFLLLFYQ